MHTLEEIKSYYKLLGFTRSASVEEIKKAYETEALKCHPDKNPGQEREATVKFQNLQNTFFALIECVNIYIFDDFPSLEEAEAASKFVDNKKAKKSNYFKFDKKAKKFSKFYNKSEKTDGKKDSPCDEETNKYSKPDDFVEETYDDINKRFQWEKKSSNLPDIIILDQMIDPFLKSTCFNGFDGPEGFYQVYGNLFTRISKFDMEFRPSKNISRPHFGSTKSSVRVVKNFYKHWLSYATYKSYIDQEDLNANSRKKLNNMLNQNQNYRPEFNKREEMKKAQISKENTKANQKFKKQEKTFEQKKHLMKITSLIENTYFNGYDDGPEGFFQVFGDIFQIISAEDVNFWDDDKFKRPIFGNSKSCFRKVVKPFYENWLSYDSYSIFSGKGPKGVDDQKVFEEYLSMHDRSEIENITRRDMEVRRLVRYVQKIDSRFK
ncbi:DNAJC21 [Cordylochernes scorpioides]|uniref:DNAJC21 n=1 Tax=Cordylochernes scorpioides TaxID=51811 RepID=A0ABY6KWT4_9ARAC|nr:DNAJC21 [Cordylochernes scorpioides]